MAKREPIPEPPTAFTQIVKRALVGSLDGDECIVEFELDDNQTPADGARIYVTRKGDPDNCVALPLEALPQVINILQAFYDETEA
jgi:hypothetical protein